MAPPKRIVISVALGGSPQSPCGTLLLLRLLDFPQGQGYMSALSGGFPEASGAGSRQGFENAGIGV
jgi:hypothetical protein